MKKISLVYNSKKILTKKSIYMIWIPIIIISKILRYTVLKNTLVVNSIGYQFLRIMQYDNLQFDLLERLTKVADTTGNAAFIYNALNVLGLNTYGQFEVAITIVSNIICMLFVNSFIDYIDDLQFCFLSILLAALNIFDFCLSKEPIQLFLFFILAYIIWKTSNNEMKCVSLLTGYILFISISFRTYFLLIIPFAGFTLFIYKWCLREKRIGFSIFLLFICEGIVYVLCLLIAKKVDPGIYSELLRVRTRMVPSKTRITPLISNANNLFMYMVNYLAVVLRLLFPIELMRMGFQYIVYFGSQLIITITFFKSIIHIKASDTVCKFAIIIFTGFLFMSAVHEIEFGSWIRHEAAIFPILVMLNSHEVYES